MPPREPYSTVQFKSTAPGSPRLSVPHRTRHTDWRTTAKGGIDGSDQTGTISMIGRKTTGRLAFAAKARSRAEDRRSSAGARRVRSFVLDGGEMALPRGDEGQLRKPLKNKHKSAWLHVHCYHHLLPPATQCLRGPSRCGAPTVARAPQGTRCTGLTRAAALSAGRREMPQGIQASSSFRNTTAYWKPWPRGSH